MRSTRSGLRALGLSTGQAGGDPGALMKLSVENKVRTPFLGGWSRVLDASIDVLSEFFKESLAHVSLGYRQFSSWLILGPCSSPWLDQCQIHLIDVLSSI